MSETFWPYGSGGELATYLWVRVLSPLLSITVVTARISEDTVNKLQSTGVDVVLLNELDVSSRSRLWSSLERAQKSIENLLQDHDVVWIPRLCYPVIQVAKQMAKPVIVHLHDYVSIDPSGAVVSPRYGYSMLSLLGFTKCFRRLLSVPTWRKVIAFLDSADATIFVSNRQRDIICARRPSLCRFHSVIPNPLPRVSTTSSTTELLNEVFDVINGHEYVLFGGGLSKLKGFDIVKKLAKLLSKRGIITVVSKAHRFTFNKDLGILYVPRLSYAEYIELLRHAKAFLYPSVYEEPLPYAVIEALLMGIPPVVTNIGGMPEILGERYLMYINDRQWNTLNNVIEKLMKRYDEIIEYVKNRAEILKDTWHDEKLRKVFISILKNVVEEQ